MFRDAFERLLFAARFLLAPLYLALAVSLVAILFKSGLHLYDLLWQLPTLNDEQVLLSELAIVDLTLTASLVVIVFLSGYTNFVAPVAMRKDDGRPHDQRLLFDPGPVAQFSGGQDEALPWRNDPFKTIDAVHAEVAECSDAAFQISERQPALPRSLGESSTAHDQLWQRQPVGV